MANVSSSNGIEKYPKLRFPEFTEPWKMLSAEELFENIVDKNHPDDTVLTIIQGSGTLPRSESSRNIRYDEKGVANYKKVNTYDYIIHLRSFEGGLEMANSQGIISPAYTVLRSKKEFAPLFYDAYFHTDEFINHILAKSVEGIRDGRQISYEAFKWLPIPTCNIEEQKKIAALLRVLNNRIKTQQLLVEALKKYKRGLLQAVFNQRIRLTKSEENWQIYRIGDLLKICHGKDYKNISSQQKTYPVLGTGGVIDYVDEYICNWPCVLIGRKGTINKPQYMETPFWSVDTLFYSKPNKNQHPKFQFYLFQTINWQKYNEASGVPSLSSSTIEGIKVNVPNYETQAEISNIFSFIDCRIESTEKSLNNLLLLKKALLQQLFI